MSGYPFCLLRGLMNRLQRILLLHNSNYQNAAIPIEFSDDFARADGVVGNDWSGATWAIDTGEVVNTPVLGSEILTDGAMENWNSATDLTNWIESLAGTSSVNQESSIVHGGTYAARLDIDGSGSLVYIYQSPSSVNAWAIFDGWIRSTGSALPAVSVNGGLSSPVLVSDGAYTRFKSALYAAGNRVQVIKVGGSSSSIYTDDNSFKHLTTSELFLTRPVYPTSDYILEVDVSALSLGAVAGIVFALDDPSNPQNYVVAILGGFRPGLYQFKAGVRANKIATLNPQPTVVSSGTLKVVKLGDDVRLYLDDVIVDTTKVLDSDVSAGLYAGIFSTNEGETLGNWSETVRAEGGSTDFLMPFFNNPDGNILFIGDSITDGATDETGAYGFPVIVTDSLNVSHYRLWQESPDRISGGGWTVAYMASAIDTRLAAATGTPTLISVLFGANDTGTGTLPDETTYKTNVAYILDALQTKYPGVPIVWSTNHWEGHEAVLSTIAEWNADVIAGYSGVYTGIEASDSMSGHPEWFVDVAHPNFAGFTQYASLFVANYLSQPFATTVFGTT